MKPHFAVCKMFDVGLPLQYTQVCLTAAVNHPILAILSFHILQNDTRIIRTRIKDELLGGFLQISRQSDKCTSPTVKSHKKVLLRYSLAMILTMTLKTNQN